MNKFMYLLKQCDHRLIILPVILSITGISSLASLSQHEGLFLSREVLIQSAALIIGVISAFIVLNLGYRYFIALDKFIYIGSLALLLSVYIPGIGASFYGSRAWIDIGFITFQPSEPVKICFVILMASFLSRNTHRLNSFKGILLSVLYGLPFILLVAKEDFGSACVYCAIWLFMVFCSGLELKIIGRFALGAAVLFPMFYFFLAGYQKDRIDAFLNPENMNLPGTYQVWNAKTAIGSGGFRGKGYLNGTHADLGFLPVPESDFIFAATAEELGFIGGAAILVIFAFFIYEALKISKYSPDLHGTLIGAGISGMFFFQSFENIAMNMGIMPVTGIPLPFMSYGGSALVSAMIGVGFLLSISIRQKL